MKKYDIQYTEIVPLLTSSVLKTEQEEKKPEEQLNYILVKREKYEELQKRNRKLWLSIFQKELI